MDFGFQSPTRQLTGLLQGLASPAPGVEKVGVRLVVCARGGPRVPVTCVVPSVLWVHQSLWQQLATTLLMSRDQDVWRVGVTTLTTLYSHVAR